MLEIKINTRVGVVDGNNNKNLHIVRSTILIKLFSPPSNIGLDVLLFDSLDCGLTGGIVIVVVVVSLPLSFCLASMTDDESAMLTTDDDVLTVTTLDLSVFIIGSNELVDLFTAFTLFTRLLVLELLAFDSGNVRESD